MNHPFSDPHSLSKALIACLIISLMILSPLAPLAYAGPTFSTPVKGTSSTAPSSKGQFH